MKIEPVHQENSEAIESESSSIYIEPSVEEHSNYLYYFQQASEVEWSECEQLGEEFRGTYLDQVAIYLLIVSGSVCPFRGAISTGHVPQVHGLFLGLIGGMHGHVTLLGSPLRVRSLMRRVVG